MNLIDRLLASRQATTYPYTPGINPNAPGPETMMGQNPGMVGPPAPPPEMKGPPATLANPGAGEQAPRQGALDAILGAFGKPGKQVQDFIKPGTDALSGVLGSFQGAAERGQLGAIAPRFQAGVNAAQERALQEMMINARGNQQAAANTNVQSTFRGQNGNMWMVTRDGRTVDSGVKYSTNVRLFEQPDGSVMAIDTTTGEEVGRPVTAEDARNAIVRGAQADAQADASVNLPDAVSRTERTLDMLDRMESHEGLSGAVGMKNISSAFGISPDPFPGSKEADFVSMVNQVGGEAFLRAFQDLKGGGHITEIEGLKAEQAIARIRDRNQSEAGYKQSIQDLKNVLRNGLEKQKRQASGDFSAPEKQEKPIEEMTDEELKAIINGTG